MTEPSERVPYKQGGISLALGKRFQVELPGTVFRARLTGLLFETSKSFLLPSAVHGMRALKRLFDEHKKLELLVTGHTDRAGSDDYNLTLSNERAQSMSAYLRDAVDEWMKFYGKNIAEEKRWGAREDGLMLGQVVPADKLPDPGSPPPATTGNVSAFQKLSNETRGTSLPTDGKITQDTRRELVAAYMAQPDTTLPKGVVPLTHGCGPFHNEVPTGPGVAEQRNRRAEIFFFEGPVKPPPRKTCPGPKGCPEYPEWVKRTTKTIDLDRGVGTLTVQVQDPAGAPIEGAAIHLEGPFSEDGKTDAKGTASFPDMPAGSYTVAAVREGFEDGQTSAVLGDGSQVTAKLSLKARLFDFDVLVQSDAKEPLQEAVVEINAPGISSAKTNKEGIARLTGVPGGKFQLTAAHPGFNKGTVDTPVPPARAKGPSDSGDSTTAGDGSGEGPVPIQLQSTPATLVVKVVNAVAKPPAVPEPIGGATVRVLPPGSGAEQTKKTNDKSDKAHAGEASFDNLPPGKATVRVEADGFKAGQAEAVLTGGTTTTIEVALDAATGKLVVHVTDDLGAAVDDKDVLVTVQPPGSAKALTAPTASGKATIENVPIGKCKIVASKPGFADGDASADVVAAQTKETPVQLKRQLGELTVTVVTPSGELLQDAVVVLERDKDRREAKTEKSGDTPPFKDVPAGKWKVSARLDNFTAPAPEEIEVKAAAGQKKTITLTPANVTASIAATAPVTLPLVVVKKKDPCTPARKQITLSVKGTFTGGGTGRFTRSKDTVKFFTAASAGAEIKFDGKDNVFSAADLTAGKQLFAEGGATSTAKEDTELKLELLVGSNAIGTPATAKATCVELTIDLFLARTAPAADPAKMPDADKTKVGRFLHLQSGAKHSRAMAVVRDSNPDIGATLELHLVKSGAGDVKLFDAETAGAAAALKVAKADFAKAKAIGGSKGVPVFVEGSAVSNGLRDLFLQVGIEGVEPDGDRAVLTVFQITQIEASLANTKCRRTGVRAAASKVSSNADQAPFAAGEPAVAKHCGDLDFVATVKPAATPLSWIAVQATDDAGPKKTPAVKRDAANFAKMKLTADAEGSFAIHAFMDQKGDETKRAPAESGMTLNLHMVNCEVQTGAADTKMVTTDLRTASVGGGFLSVRTGTNPLPGAGYGDGQLTLFAFGMKVTVKVTGGGPNRLRGLDRIGMGYIQDVVADSVVATYADGKTEKEVLAQLPLPPGVGVGGIVTAGALPLLALPVRDHKSGSDRGSGTFINGSDDSDRTDIPAGAAKAGQTWRLRMLDPPAIGVSTTHPVSGSPLASLAGTNDFHVYAVAFSQDFDENFTVLVEGTWSAHYGSFNPGAGGWQKTGNHSKAGPTVHNPPKKADDTGVEHCRPAYTETFVMDAR